MTGEGQAVISNTEAIRAEKAAFEEMLPRLQESLGKYAIVQGGWLVDICDTAGEAYARGIEYCGMDDGFLVSKITEPGVVEVVFIPSVLGAVE